MQLSGIRRKFYATVEDYHAAYQPICHFCERSLSFNTAFCVFCAQIVRRLLAHATVCHCLGNCPVLPCRCPDVLAWQPPPPDDSLTEDVRCPESSRLQTPDAETHDVPDEDLDASD
jgi:hypothetical protein